MRKLLILDDSSDLLFAIQESFSLYNFTTRTVTDIANLFKELKSFNPEIIIIDVFLKRENGRDLCKQLREDPTYNHTTLILFSSSSKYLLNYQECGADGTIEKPFGIKELIEKIEAAVQYRKNINEKFY